jgi:hypothetical protein
MAEPETAMASHSRAVSRDDRVKFCPSWVGPTSHLRQALISGCRGRRWLRPRRPVLGSWLESVAVHVLGLAGSGRSLVEEEVHINFPCDSGSP